MRFYCYPKCSTCNKAKTHLQRLQAAFEEINIKVSPPSKEELYQILTNYQIPIQRLFNTSGESYRALQLKDRWKSMDEEVLLDMLAKDGMLIKRPILIGKHGVLIGYKEEKYDVFMEEEGKNDDDYEAKNEETLS